MQLGFFGAGIVFVLVVGLANFRLGSDHGGREWSLAWACVYLSGLTATLASQWPPLQLVYPVLGTLFAALSYAGTLRFVERAVPPWLFPGAALVGVGRGLLYPFVDEGPTQAMGAICISVAVIASAGTLWNRRARASGWDTALALGFPAILLATWSYAYGKYFGLPPESGMAMWLFCGVLLSGLQLSAILGLIAQRSEDERATLRALIEEVPVGLALSDAAGRTRMLNQEMERQLGLELREGAGRSFADLVRRLQDAVERDDQRFLAGLEDRSIVAPEARLEPRRFHFRDGRVSIGSMQQVRGPEGRLGQLWLLRDITRDLELQDELRRARQLETLGRLAGGVAHDFNNKIMAIVGNAALVRATLDPGDARHASLADLEDAAAYCAALTNDLLDFAQRAPRKPIPIDLAAFLPVLVDRIRADIPPEISLRLSVDPSVPHVAADPTQLERVLTNLVRNARDAIESTGAIEVGAQLDATAEFVAISVRDDGRGIDPEDQERVFDPFFSATPGGNGLGLAIVYGIVTSHGGHVGLESSPGKGTHIKTTWRASEAAEDVEALALPLREGRGETLLVVDDERAVLRVTTLSLERSGYRVVGAASGSEALERLAATDAIDVALVDLTMPEMDGLELADRIHGVLPELPVVLMSGNLGRAHGRTDLHLLSKPFRTEQLLSLLADILADPSER